VNRGTPRLAGTALRVYHAALFLCPPAFRREFSAEMVRDVADQIDEARVSRGAGAPLVLWMRLGADLVATAAIQWLRTGAPVLAACSLIAALAATRVAANVLLHQALPVPEAPHDRDVLTLLLLTGTVLLVIVATIVFTFWFAHPASRRLRR